ncbi:unnamed protein product, partial [Mesorhabditis belari]|uniref:Bis(5'-nucleosyl)-tetraphosphatase [asymmetrical] n=1 Tax=Mesorhabditis belari TaxID=2138241 RepID=A0AAF3FDF0_9BILA
MARSAGLFLVKLSNSEEPLFLLLQASKHPHHWSPPKGHIDPGESDLEAAIRETEEETSYKRETFEIMENSMDQISYLITESVAHPEDVGKMKTAVYWLARMSDEASNVQISSEHTNMKWVTLEEAHEKLTLPGMSDLLKKYAKLLQERH